MSLEFLDRVLIKKRFYILDTLGGLTPKVFSKHGMHTECIQAVGVQLVSITRFVALNV